MGVITIKGHHGTDINSCEAILESNYKISEGDQHWLGEGVYFFIEGLSTDTINLAKKWAIAEAWDNDNKKYKYKARLNVSLIRRKENYITLTRPFITDEYLNSVEFVEKDYIPTLEQIEAARKNLINNNKLINYYNMKKTIGYLINGVIDPNDQNNYNFVEDVRKNFIKEIAERKKAKRRLQYSRIAVKRRD